MKNVVALDKFDQTHPHESAAPMHRREKKIKNLKSSFSIQNFGAKMCVCLNVNMNKFSFYKENVIVRQPS